VGDPHVSNQSVSNWFNPAAFANPAFGTFGTSGRNTLIGPSFADVDFGVAKEFSLHWEGIKVGVRGDFYDLFNHINFANPDANVGYVNGVLADPTAGKITGPAGFNGNRRIIQLGARLTF